MRKHVIMLVILLVLSSLVSTALAISDDTGIWTKKAYVDEFEMPTDEFYFCNAEPLIGKFSNSATTDSPLSVWIFIHNDLVSVKLIEYGTSVVKNAYSTDRLYNIVMMNPNGEKFYFDGTMSSGHDTIRFNSSDNDLILNALSSNGTVRFAISEDNSPLTKYLFTINDSTGLFDLLPYSYVDSFNDGLALVKRGGKYGYIDTSCNVVIPCMYDNAYSFSNGLTMVNNAGKYICLNTMGQQAFPDEFSNALWFNDSIAGIEINEKWGFIDISGNIIVPCDFDGIQWYADGFAAVQKNGKWGCIDTSSNIVIIPFEYDAINQFSEGLIAVKQGAKWGFADSSGALVIPCEYDYVQDFSNGLALVKTWNWGFDICGFIEKDGNVNCLCRYDMDSFYDNRALIKDGKWGYVDINYATVIPCQFDFARSFCEGIAAVNQNGEWGFIDINGCIIVNYEYDEVQDFSNGLAKVKKDGKWGAIDDTGRLLVPCEYDIVSYNDNFFSLLRNGELEVISLQG